MSILGFINDKLPCPRCKQVDLRPLKDLVGAASIGCRYCGYEIDLQNAETSAHLRLQARTAEEVWFHRMDSQR